MMIAGDGRGSAAPATSASAPRLPLRPAGGGGHVRVGQGRGAAGSGRGCHHQRPTGIATDCHMMPAGPGAARPPGRVSLSAAPPTSTVTRDSVVA